MASLAAGCKGGHVFFSAFNGGTITNCTFEQGTQTISPNAIGSSGICTTVAHYVTYGSGACWLEQFTTITITASTYVFADHTIELLTLCCLYRHHVQTFACRFVGNAASGGAGGVVGAFQGSTASVDGCNFTANATPNGVGSGVFVVGLQTLNVVNSTFVGNGGEYVGKTELGADAVPVVHAL